MWQRAGIGHLSDIGIEGGEALAVLYTGVDYLPFFGLITILIGRRVYSYFAILVWVMKSLCR